MAPKRSVLKIADGGGLVGICDISIVAVLVKVLPPLKNWSAPKLPVAPPPALIERVVAAAVGVTVGVGVGPPADTVRPLILGFWVPAMNWITTWPLALAVVVNERAMARLAPPAAAKISKLVKTVAPLMDTLKRRCPAPDRKVSAKYSVTVWAPLRLGRV